MPLAGEVVRKSYLCPHAARGYRVKLHRKGYIRHDVRQIIGASLSEPHTSESNGGFFIGASVSEPLLSDVYVDFVCHGPADRRTA